MSTVELDERLRELFSDERLDLPARDDAVPRIVGGARRRRRTRAAATGALVVAAVVGGVVVSQALTTRVTSEPGTSRTSTVTVRPQALEPSAHGPFRLGMPESEVRRPGYEATAAGPCRRYGSGETSYELLVSPQRGAAAIRIPVTSRTPSGVGRGTTVEQLHRSYPDVVVDGDRAAVVVGSDWRYVFRLEQGKVSVVWMETTDGECGSGG
ncbi:MAG: hypothetical protein HOY78_47660 [Saccharothrix sp.]|nr:hypothetical protein [Saccharothrix sp.]